MKIKYLASAILAVCTALSSCATTTGTTSSASTQDSPLGNLLGGLAGKNSGSSSSSSTDSKSGSSLGGLLGGVISGLISNDDVNPTSMVGTWSYSGPAVSFQSDNFLQKAGGSAAAGVIEGKLEPYYKKLKLNQLVLTINEDLTFSMQSGVLKAGGTIEKAENGDIVFNFQALKSINIGSMRAYVTMTGSNTMSLMFDVSKLITIVKTIGSVTGSSTVNTISSLLDSYDGICAGFMLTRKQ